MVDQRELAIAAAFTWLADGVPPKTKAGPLLEAFRKAIEAYEAARWRPICEVPITPNEPVYPTYVEMFNGYHVGIGYVQESYDDENVLEFWSETGEPIEPKPIKFRTIEPPTQDAVSCHSQGPPAADAKQEVK